MDRIDSLTERKMKSMNQKVMDAKASYNIAQSIKLIRRDCSQNRQNNFFHRNINKMDISILSDIDQNILSQG